MVPSRETVYTALMTFLATAVGAQTVSRVTVPESVIAGASLPFIEQLPSSEGAESQGANLPVRWRIRQPVSIYVDTSGVNVVGDTIVNNMLDALEAALKPNVVTGYQTLNGTVIWCRMQGVLLKEPGYQTNIGAALVAIELLTTS